MKGNLIPSLRHLPPANSSSHYQLPLTTGLREGLHRQKVDFRIPGFFLLLEHPLLISQWYVLLPTFKVLHDSQ